MGSERTYVPGTLLRLTGPGVGAKSVTVRDLEGDLTSWMGTKEWTKHVYQPNLSARDYMAGVVRFSDQKTRFVFQLLAGEPLRPVGYRKLQLHREDGALAAIQTSVIAEEYAGRGYATATAAPVDWFLATELGVELMAPRVYEENTAAQEKLLHIGYRHVRTVEEPGRSGVIRKVRIYHRRMDEWLERLGSRVSEFRWIPLHPND